MTRAEAWRLTCAALRLTGNEGTVETLEYAARLIGKDPFDVLDRFRNVSEFQAFCTARTLGANDETLRAVLKVQRRPTEWR